MPARSLRPCPYPGCRELVRIGLCEKHAAARQKATRTELDEHRPSAARRGYGRRWRAYREAWLNLHPLCGDRFEGTSAAHSTCRGQNINTPASVVDHIERHQGNATTFWDPNNHQSLCKACHDAKTQSERHELQQVGRVGQILGS